MNESTTEGRIVPPPEGRDVLTGMLRDGAGRLPAWAIDAEVAARIDDHARLRDGQGPEPPPADCSRGDGGPTAGR